MKGTLLGLNEAWSFTLEINAFTWMLGVLFLGNKKKEKKRKKKNVFVRCFSSNIQRLKRRQIVYVNLYIHEYAHIHIIHMYTYRGTIYTYISTDNYTYTDREANVI